MIQRFDGGSGAFLWTFGSKVIKVGRGTSGRRKVKEEAEFLRWIHRRCDPTPFISVRSPRALDALGVLVTERAGSTARDLALEGRGDVIRTAVEHAGEAIGRLGVRLRRPQSNNQPAEWARALVADRSRDVVSRFGSSVEMSLSALLVDLGRLTAQPVMCSPFRTVVHGDAHLGNLLIDDNRYEWIDPRGFFDGSRQFDPAYDLAKIAHEPALVHAMGATREDARKVEELSRRLFAAYWQQWSNYDEAILRRAAFFGAINLVSALTFGRVRTAPAAHNMLRLARSFVASTDRHDGIASAAWL